MNLPKGFVLPAIFNLGVAPPPPQDARRFQPRAKLCLPGALGTLPPGASWGGTSGLSLSAFMLPPIALAAAVTPPLQAGLIPNPYLGQW